MALQDSVNHTFNPWKPDISNNSQLKQFIEPLSKMCTVHLKKSVLCRPTFTLDAFVQNDLHMKNYIYMRIMFCIIFDTEGFYGSVAKTSSKNMLVCIIGKYNVNQYIIVLYNS